jgi:hypothetical protein
MAMVSNPSTGWPGVTPSGSVITSSSRSPSRTGEIWMGRSRGYSGRSSAVSTRLPGGRMMRGFSVGSGSAPGMMMRDGLAGG